MSENDREQVEKLKAELAAACELHERSMRIIEAELPKDRPNRDTWRAKAIAADIAELRREALNAK